MEIGIELFAVFITAAAGVVVPHYDLHIKPQHQHEAEKPTAIVNALKALPSISYNHTQISDDPRNNGRNIQRSTLGYENGVLEGLKAHGERKEHTDDRTGNTYKNEVQDDLNGLSTDNSGHDADQQLNIHLEVSNVSDNGHDKNSEHKGDIKHNTDKNHEGQKNHEIDEKAKLTVDNQSQDAQIITQGGYNHHDTDEVRNSPDQGEAKDDTADDDEDEDEDLDDVDENSDDDEHDYVAFDMDDIHNKYGAYDEFTWYDLDGGYVWLYSGLYGDHVGYGGYEVDHSPYSHNY